MNTLDIEGPYCDIPDKPTLWVAAQVRTLSILTGKNEVDIWWGIQCIIFECSPDIQKKLKHCISFQDNSNGVSSQQYQRNKPSSDIYEKVHNIWGCKVGKIWDYEIIVDILVFWSKCFIRPISEVVIWTAIEKWIENNTDWQKAIKINSFQGSITIHD